MLKYLGILLLVVSCASVKKITLPDGREGHLLDCTSKSRCYEEARKVCNGNYDILESGIIGGKYSSVTYTIACKK